MIPCLLFALAVFLCKQANFPNLLNVGKLHQASSQGDDSLSGYPHRFRENQNDWSFAGRTKLDLRLPFGPNPQQKYIQEQKFFSDTTTQKNYSENLRQMHIENQDWRLDLTTNSRLNNFAEKPHMPENNLRRLNVFSVERDCLNENKEFFY